MGMRGKSAKGTQVKTADPEEFMILPIGVDDITEVMGRPTAVEATGLKIVEQIPHWWDTVGSVDEALGFFNRRERVTPLKGEIGASM